MELYSPSSHGFECVVRLCVCVSVSAVPRPSLRPPLFHKHLTDSVIFSAVFTSVSQTSRWDVGQVSHTVQKISLNASEVIFHDIKSKTIRLSPWQIIIFTSVEIQRQSPGYTHKPVGLALSSASAVASVKQTVPSSGRKRQILHFLHQKCKSSESPPSITNLLEHLCTGRQAAAVLTFSFNKDSFTQMTGMSSSAQHLFLILQCSPSPTSLFTVFTTL